MKLTKMQIDTLYDTIMRKDLRSFTDFGGELLFDPGDKSREALFIPGSKDAKVLAVGHTDVRLTATPKMTMDTLKVVCPQLDDRLGVWIILHILRSNVPKDMPYDILLTDNEEIGDSTADLYLPKKKYNWMFEFDRKGTDVVMYGYKNKELEDLLGTYNFEVGFGSFTDICQLDRLGCAGFNFGTGYHDEHTLKCHANLKDTAKMISKFLIFYKDQYNNHLKGDLAGAKSKRRNKWGGNSYRKSHDFDIPPIDDYISLGGYEYHDDYWKKDIQSSLSESEIDLLLANEPELRLKYWEGGNVERMQVIEELESMYIDDNDYLDDDDMISLEEDTVKEIKNA